MRLTASRQLVCSNLETVRNGPELICGACRCNLAEAACFRGMAERDRPAACCCFLLMCHALILLRALTPQALLSSN